MFIGLNSWIVIIVKVTSEVVDQSFSKRARSYWINMLSQCFIPLELPSSPKRQMDDISLSCSFRVGVVHVKGTVGSSYFEFGGTKVMCCVLCPRPCTRQSVQSAFLDRGVFECEVRFASCVARDDEVREEKLASWIQSAFQSAILLHMYPKQLISLSVTVLQTSKHDLSAIVNGATLALADASVQMRDLTCSYSVFLLRDDKVEDEDQVSPSAMSARVDAEFTVAMLPALGVTSNTLMSGRWSTDMVSAADHSLALKCKQLRELMVSKLKHP